MGPDDAARLAEIRTDHPRRRARGGRNRLIFAAGSRSGASVRPASTNSRYRNDRPAARRADHADRPWHGHGTEHGDHSQPDHRTADQRRLQGGSIVKKGDLLAQIDPRTYQAQLDQAEATLAHDQAHLKNARAQPPALQRAWQNRIPSRSNSVDNQQAAVDELNAQIKSDQAAVENAKTQLSYTRLVAPFDGVTGFRLLDVGNIIHPPTSTAATATATATRNRIEPGGRPCRGHPGSADQRDFHPRHDKHTGGSGRDGEGTAASHRLQPGRQDAARHRQPSCRE